MKGFGEQKSEEYQIFRQWMGWKWETVRFSKFSSKILADFSNQLENHEPKGHAFSLVLRALKAMPCNEFRLNHRFFCGLWLHMAVLPQIPNHLGSPSFLRQFLTDLWSAKSIDRLRLLPSGLCVRTLSDCKSSLSFAYWKPNAKLVQISF